MSELFGRVTKIIAEARATLPWPQRVPLPDGSMQVGGLSEEEIAAHIAKSVIEGLFLMKFTPHQLKDAARAVFDRESQLIGEPGADVQFQEGFALYAAVAEAGYRAILAEISRP